MRKFYISLILVFVLLFMLSGCANPAQDGQTSDPNTSEDSSTTDFEDTTDVPNQDDENTTEESTDEKPEDTSETESSTETETEQDTSYVEQISRDDQSIFDGPTYDSSFVGTVEVAGSYTIVEEVLDEEGNLWGRLKSGAGWVDLTDIRSPERANAPISANFADDRLIESGNFHHCIADTSEYMVQVAFRANGVLTNVSFVSMEFNGEIYEAAEVLFTIPELTPEKPFVADVAFPGDMSCYGISFTDSNGELQRYYIYISGRNGALILSEYAD